MHHVPRTKLTLLAVAGPVERRVRPRCERGELGLSLRTGGSGGLAAKRVVAARRETAGDRGWRARAGRFEQPAPVPRTFVEACRSGLCWPAKERREDGLLSWRASPGQVTAPMLNGQSKSANQSLSASGAASGHGRSEASSCRGAEAQRRRGGMRIAGPNVRANRPAEASAVSPG